MEKQQNNRPLLSDELERPTDQLDFNNTEQEVRDLLEQNTLPTSRELEKYNELIPNGAERIFNLIEDERIHRREIELKKNGGRNRLNQLISASGLVLGILLIFAVMTNPYTEINIVFLLVCAAMVLILILAPLFKSKIKG